MSEGVGSTNATAIAALVLALSLAPTSALPQERSPPTLQAAPLAQGVAVDGVLSEAAWTTAAATDAFTQTDPTEGAAPTGRTIVRVLAGPKALVIGVVCEDPEPNEIVSYSVRRDASLNSEDHVRIVLGPFLDGRSGYVFAVNPGGARYDGLIAPSGENDNADWDGIWEAATSRSPAGWSVEIRIPVQTLSFKPGLREWHFNVQRRIQRLLETDRWASPARQYQVTQTSRAGLLTGLPDFALGLGLTGWVPSASAQFVMQAKQTKTPPVIDGVLADGEWSDAAVAAGFVQFEPQRGEPSPFRTEALLLYDARHLYVAFRAWDPEPLTAQLTQRDAQLDRDDAVGVLIDTFADRQTAYFFALNVLGTQADARVADDGRTTDFNWDAPWRAAASRTPWGWTAELSVPFSAIKYVAGADRSWGLNFVRSRRRTLELSHWAGPLEQPYRVSQFGQLTGLTLAPQERRQQIIPYGLSRVQERQAPDWDVGVDARYALTPQLAAYGTLYPDFATVEADQETINLTRFEVQLREKRQFFLEGNELFGQRIRTFYSRRIADITGGGKLLGKQGPWTVAALSGQSEPLATGSRANFTVGRLQKDVLGRSNLAVLVANRRLDEVNSGSVGIDTTLFFSRTFNFTGQFVKSWGRYRDGTLAWYVRPSYDSATGHVHVRYSYLGDHVAENVNPVGQIRDDDHRELDSAVSKTIWFKGAPVERLRYDSNYNIYWSTRSDVVRSWQIDEGLSADFRNRVSAELDYAEEYKLFEKHFRNRRVRVTLGYNTREYQSVSAGYEFGRNFDSDYGLWRATARRKLSDESSIEYELQRVRFTPDPTAASTWIHVLRGSYFFTTDLFLRVFVQVNSAIERRNAQATFVYRYLPPFGTLQVVYQRGTAEFGQRSAQGHTVFVKATTVF